MLCNTITDLATLIWNDLGQPTDLSVPSIQTKLVNPAYLGKLNDLAVTCYQGVSGSICPALGENEQAIYAMLYEVDYYTTKLNQTLAGLNPGVISLAEGDSRMVFVSPVDKARLYRDMQKQLNDQLSMVISSYRQNRSLPMSVLYPTLVNNLNGGFGFGLGNWPQNYYRN